MGTGGLGGGVWLGGGVVSAGASGGLSTHQSPPQAGSTYPALQLLAQEPRVVNSLFFPAVRLAQGLHAWVPFWHWALVPGGHAVALQGRHSAPSW